jgi:hypothetical protein
MISGNWNQFVPPCRYTTNLVLPGDTWKMRKNESDQIKLKDTSFGSVFCADSEYVFSFYLKVIFGFENLCIPSKMDMVSVKTSFRNIGKKRKKNYP